LETTYLKKKDVYGRYFVEYNGRHYVLDVLILRSGQRKLLSLSIHNIHVWICIK